jgi:hypothetical protein
VMNTVDIMEDMFLFGDIATTKHEKSPMVVCGFVRDMIKFNVNFFGHGICYPIDEVTLVSR